MKRRVKAVLQRLGWYEKIRYSPAMRIFKKLTRHPEILQHQKELIFYKSFLPAPVPLIFDIGAHHGFKAAAFLECSDRVIACDPDPYSINILERKFKGLRKRIEILPLAIGAAIGQSRFYIHQEGSAFNTLNPRWKVLLENDSSQRWNERIRFENEPVLVNVTTLDALIVQYGSPGYIKIDAEGYEMEILKGLHHSIPFISFETLLPDFTKEILLIFDHLLAISPDATFNIAIEEKLLFPAFISKEALLNWISSTTVTHLEIIVKSN